MIDCTNGNAAFMPQNRKPRREHHHISAENHASVPAKGINRLQLRTGRFVLHRSKIVTSDGQALGKLPAEADWFTSGRQSGRIIGLDKDSTQGRLAGRRFEPT